MFERVVSYFETSPLKRRLYLSVWCTSLSRVRQEMSTSRAMFNFCIIYFVALLLILAGGLAFYDEILTYVLMIYHLT